MYAEIAITLIGLTERVLLADTKGEITPAQLLEINKRLLDVNIRMSTLMERVAAQHVDVLPDPQ